MANKCEYCGGNIPDFKMSSTLYCSDICRNKAKALRDKQHHYKSKVQERKIIDFERERLASAGRILAESMDVDPWLVVHGYGEKDRWYSNADFVLGF